MPGDYLIIEGAKQNNLRSLSLEIPHNRIAVVTGVSGSGKSSLAVDTVFAEGQWRFIESLSSYARLFLEKLDRPAVDALKNVRPAVALEQRNTVRTSRNTVGMATELNDLFRLLYAATSRARCPECGSEIRSWHPQAIVDHLIDQHAGARMYVLFPAAYEDLEDLGRRGFVRFFQNGRQIERIAVDPQQKIAVVVDRLIAREEDRGRLGDSVETAWRYGEEQLAVQIVDGEQVQFSSRRFCSRCEREIPEPHPLLFSSNHPLGACPTCRGFGNLLEYDPALFVPDPTLSLAQGAIEPWQKPAYRPWYGEFLQQCSGRGIDVDRAFGSLPAKHRRLILDGDETFYGVQTFFRELEEKKYRLHVRVFLSRYRTTHPCPACGGARLRPEALLYRVSGATIADLEDLPLEKLLAWVDDLDLAPSDREGVADILGRIGDRLGLLLRVGLGYLSMGRQERTLSGGEAQRVRLVNQLSARLTGTLYVLDEPTVGLHPRDTNQICDVMEELAGLGNTLLVVEHDRTVIERSHWVVELGPGGGSKGGRLLFNGPTDQFLAQSETLTAQYMRGERTLGRGGRLRRADHGWITLVGARGRNLKNVTVSFPRKLLTCVTGVSGSGKTTLVHETLYPALARVTGERKAGSPLAHDELKGTDGIRKTRLVDQSPIGRSPRSNPVTYMKAFDAIRKLYGAQPDARRRGLHQGSFSFNIPGGRCEACGGEGSRKLEMFFFEDLYVACDECKGRRYRPEVLDVRFRGKDIHQVLEMTVEEALQHFTGEVRVVERLEPLVRIGIGYLKLGQPAPTLSGGEAQRLKLCAELTTARGGGTVYLLDEPTTGLHLDDVARLMRVLDDLIEGGNTVILIEHNPDVIRQADWIVDLGPEGGEGGGELVASGPPEAIRESGRSYTGRFI